MANTDAFEALVLRVGAEDTHSRLPVDVFTGTGDDPRPRLRVDNAQTSFFENREFRVFYEFSIAAGASVYLRFDAVTENIIHGRDITLIEGQLRFSLISGGTPAGVWTPLVLRPVNTLSTRPEYIPSTTVAVGGTVTGGTEVDVMIANAGTGGNAGTATALVSEGCAPVGQAFVRLWNNGSQTCTGLYRVAFEEYQPRSGRLR